MSDSKPRFRVSANDHLGISTRPAGKAFVGDSFQNLVAGLGYGANNLSSGGTYGFLPISRNHTMLEWMYRGSWLVRQIVDCVADDMTRAGVAFDTDMPPDTLDSFTQYIREMIVWQRLNQAIKWGRLYGGCLAVIMIDGQDMKTPLNIDSIGRGQFKGLMVLDRWMLQPDLSNPVTSLGPDFGTPRFYSVVADSRAIPNMRIHHSRCIRIDGVELPYWQRIAENEWGLSVIEPIFDRLLAFDSATQGAAQLVYKAHLRTLKVEHFRELVAAGGKMYQAFLTQVATMRAMQSNEGLTVLDATDDFQTYQYGFAGLSDMLVNFGQQLSGGSQIPLVRLFGQSPAGMNATGDSDIRNYYDAINSQQEARLRRPVGTLLDIAHRSRFGKPLPEGFSFTFNPLWQLTNPEKAQFNAAVTASIGQAMQDGIIDRITALKELRQSSRVSGVWSNITDEEIRQAELDPPAPNEAMLGQMPAGSPENGPQAGAAPGQPNAPDPAHAAPETPADDAADPLPDPLGDVLHRVAVRTDPVSHVVKQVLARGAEKRAVESIVSRVQERGSAAVAAVVARVQARGHAQDTLPPMREVHGIPIVIETPKHTRRVGNGWQVQMPADYGYIQGTSSSEGVLEQMDCYVGDDSDSQHVWIINQIDPATGLHDEHKVMLGFGSRQQALDTYHAAFADNSGPLRVGGMTRTDIDGLKDWLREWSTQRAIGIAAE